MHVYISKMTKMPSPFTPYQSIYTSFILKPCPSSFILLYNTSAYHSLRRFLAMIIRMISLVPSKI